MLSCATTTGTVQRGSLPTGLIFWLLSLLPDDRKLKRGHRDCGIKDTRSPLVTVMQSRNQGRVLRMRRVCGVNAAIAEVLQLQGRLAT